MQELKHPSDRELEGFFNSNVPESELARLAEHLDACPACEARMEQLEPAWAQSRRCLDAVHARVSPAGYEPEGPLQNEFWASMERLEANRSPRRPLTWGFAWASGLAAAAAALFFFFPIGQSAELRAETLLARAARSAPRATHPLFIRTRSNAFLRPVSSAVPSEQEVKLRERFAAAQYNWQDPLNAQAYLDWRHSLASKTSSVDQTSDPQTGQPEQRVDTSTESSSLHEASLTLDASLTPVAGRFEFSDHEWVEITLAPEPAPEPVLSARLRAAQVPSPTPVAQVPEPPSSPAESLAERELEVRLAIDSLDLSTLDPVEVTVSGSGEILVSTYGIGNDLAGRLRAKLEPISGVSLHSATDAKQTADPRISTAIDRILRSSHSVSFEAHLLADLAARFPATREAELPPARQNDLWELRRKHSARMLQNLADLAHDLAEEHSGFRAAPPDLAPSPQTQPLAQSATAVDRLITSVYVREGPHASAWTDLEQEMARLEGLAAGYSKFLQGAR